VLTGIGTSSKRGRVSKSARSKVSALRRRSRVIERWFFIRAASPRYSVQEM